MPGKHKNDLRSMVFGESTVAEPADEEAQGGSRCLARSPKLGRATSLPDNIQNATVKAAKEMLKRYATPAWESLLFEAYRARIRILLRHGIQMERAPLNIM